jgi:hypothetical protein
MQEKQEQKVKVGKPKKEIRPQYIPQKIVRNESLQSLEIYFQESGKVESYWLQPKEMIQIPSNGVTPQLKLLQERRMIKMRDV